MNRTLAIALVLGLAALGTVPAAAAKTVNENTENLPPNCEEISTTREITVRGGSQFARNFTGVAYTYDEHSWDVPACAEVTVTFHNTDEVRHQFMVHGTWPSGFTLIEVDGGESDQATWIAPGGATSLMVHCGVNQHQQKGMKAQFLVDGGEGDVPNIPSVSGLPPEDRPNATNTQAADDEVAIPAPTPGLVAAIAAAGALALRRRR
jgi:hypothetical protein